MREASLANGAGDKRKAPRKMNKIIEKCVLRFRCCRVCAKTVGEACGGPGGFSGTCEPPLQCVQRLQMKGSGVCLGGYFDNKLSHYHAKYTRTRFRCSLSRLRILLIRRRLLLSVLNSERCSRCAGVTTLIHWEQQKGGLPCQHIHDHS